MVYADASEDLTHEQNNKSLIYQNLLTIPFHHFVYYDSADFT